MIFLVIAQDLRVSGTSEGMVSRSFISKLRKAYPDSIIDVVYLKHHPSEDLLHLLPIDSIQTHILDLKIPVFSRWFNKIYWRLFHMSLNERYIQKVYGSYIAKIEYKKYDHIFIRSSGLEYESILGAKNLPILKKSIVNFHDPYPLFWCAGNENQLNNLELFRLKEMYKVVSQAKSCISPAQTLSKDMEILYGAKKKIYTLPHQYCELVFDFSEIPLIRNKTKKVSISYHGAIQFGRNLDILLDAYQDLIEANLHYKENTEFVLRLKGSHAKRLLEKYSGQSNMVITDTLDLSNSTQEQATQADVLIILENGTIYSNILVGKAPFVASLQKPILVLAPERSELRRLIQNNQYIADCMNKEEIKQKLENLIINRMNSDEKVYPFGDYFSDENFKRMLDEILKACNEDY